VDMEVEGYTGLEDDTEYMQVTQNKSFEVVM
jgi:hypothetical protein